MTDRFPYDLPSREALIRLIQETYPSLNVKMHNSTVELPYFSPTINTPGRTFVEVHLNNKEQPLVFVYRRLDLDTALNSPSVIVEGAITPRAIAERLNESRGMSFGPDDVSFSEVELGEEGEQITYRMKALPQSLVWYGETTVTANSATSGENTRVTESGDDIRVTEDGETRRIENG